MPRDHGPLGELVVHGEPREAFYDLLYETSASALRTRRGQPTDPEIRELAHEVILITGLLDKLALLGSEQELRAVLRTTVKNHLVSRWRATHRGRVRRRVVDVLRQGCPGLAEVEVWGVRAWGVQGAPSSGAVADIQPEVLAARLPTLQIEWANWDSEGGRDPIAEQDELCRLILAIVEAAGGSAPAWSIAEAVRLAAGLPDDGQVLGWAQERATTPADDDAWVAVASEEILGVLSPTTLEWLCALLAEQSVRDLEVETGISKSTVARRLASARADVAEVLKRHDAAGPILLHIYDSNCGTSPPGSAFSDTTTARE